METIQELIQWLDKEGINATALEDITRITDITTTGKLLKEFMEEQEDKQSKFIWLTE